MSFIPFTPFAEDRQAVLAQFAERSRWGASDIDGRTREDERVGTDESNRLRFEGGGLLIGKKVFAFNNELSLIAS
jgi:hypothetical protein